MLKKRIITTLLFDEKLSVVKPIGFKRPHRVVGNLRQYLNTIERRNVDELMLIDITATEQGRRPNHVELGKLLDNIFCPVSVGGGISCLDDIGYLLNSGADKVVIRSKYTITYDAARKYGSQAIISAVDYPIGPLIDQFTVEVVAAMMQSIGAGEILLTECDRDGKLCGYGLELIRMVSNNVSIPVIANGGCGHPSDMVEAFQAGADAVAAGSMFLYTDWTPAGAADVCAAAGIEVRRHRG